MTRSRHVVPQTGVSGFLLGVVTSSLVNLATENPQSWPRALRIAAEHPWTFLLLLSMGFLSKAIFERFRPSSAPIATWTGGNPYPGLVAYDAERSAVFCGREPETRQVHDRVLRGRSVAARFVPLIGPSGAGKSSLLQAGIIPALTKHATVLAPFTPGNDPFGSLARALLPGDEADADELARDIRTYLESEEPGAAARLVMDRLAAGRGRGRRVILPIDQLEELTTLSTAADRGQFLALITAVLAVNDSVCVIATLRSESVAFFQQDPSAALFDRPVMVNVIREQRLATVIHGPARSTGVRYEEGLVDDILREAMSGDVLPMLSYLLAELHDRMDQRVRVISRRDYEAAGGVSGAIARRAEAALDDVCDDDRIALAGSDDRREQILEILLAFVSLRDEEPARRWASLGCLDAAAQAVVARFLQERLLVTRDGDDAVTVAHEALLRQWPPLQQKIRQRMDAIRCRTELEPIALAWQRSGKDPDFLVSGSRLRDILERLGDHDLPGAPPLVAAFVQASRRSDTADSRRRADQVAAKAREVLRTDPALAIQLAKAALTELAHTPGTELTAYAAVATGLRLAVSHGAAVTCVNWSSDGRLAAGGEDGTISIWAVDGSLLVRLDGESGRVLTVGWSRAGQIAVGTADGVVRIYGPQFDLQHHSNPSDGAVHGLAWSSDGDMVTAHADGALCVWKAPGDVLRQTIGWCESPALAVCYAPLGGEFVAANESGTVYLRRLERYIQDLYEETTVYELGRTALTSISWGPGGRIVVGDEDDTVWMLDRSEPAKRPIPLSHHSGGVCDVAWSPEGRLATAARTGSVRIWSRTGTILRQIDAGALTPSLAWGPAGLLALGTADGQVRVWQPYWDLKVQGFLYRGGVNALAWNATGTLAAGFGDGTVMLWHGTDATTGEEFERRAIAFRAHDASVLAMSWSADCLTTEGADGDRADWDDWGQPCGDGRLSHALHVLGDAEPPSNPGTGWRLNGQALAVGNRLDDALKSLGDTSGGQVVATVDGAVWLLEPERPPCRLIGATAATKHNGSRILVTTPAGAQIRESSGRIVAPLTDHDTEILTVAWSADGRAVTGAANGVVRIWSDTGHLLHTLTDHPHPITGLAWSPEGYLATADESGLLLVWDARLSAVPDALESCALQPLDKNDRQFAGLGPTQPRILSPAARQEVL